MEIEGYWRTRTIAEAQDQGYSHLRATCSGCGRISDLPWPLLLRRRGDQPRDLPRERASNRTLEAVGPSSPGRPIPAPTLLIMGKDDHRGVFDGKALVIFERLGTDRHWVIANPTAVVQEIGLRGDT